MDLGPIGTIKAKVNDIIVQARGSVDVKSLQIVKDLFFIKSISNMEIQFEGNALTDWLLNTLTKVVLTVFKEQIRGIFSDRINVFLDDLIYDLNHNKTDVIKNEAIKMITLAKPYDEC